MGPVGIANRIALTLTVRKINKYAFFIFFSFALLSIFFISLVVMASTVPYVLVLKYSPLAVYSLNFDTIITKKEQLGNVPQMAETARDLLESSQLTTLANEEHSQLVQTYEDFRAATTYSQLATCSDAEEHKLMKLPIYELVVLPALLREVRKCKMWAQKLVLTEGQLRLGVSKYDSITLWELAGLLDGSFGSAVSKLMLHVLVDEMSKRSLHALQKLLFEGVDKATTVMLLDEPHDKCYDPIPAKLAFRWPQAAAAAEDMVTRLHTRQDALKGCRQFVKSVPAPQVPAPVAADAKSAM